MSVGIEGLFTNALGLVPPWEVDKVELDTARRRIDFEVRCQAKVRRAGCAGQSPGNDRAQDHQEPDVGQVPRTPAAGRSSRRMRCTGCSIRA